MLLNNIICYFCNVISVVDLLQFKIKPKGKNLNVSRATTSKALRFCIFNN